MFNFLEGFKTQIITTIFILIIFLILRFSLKLFVKKNGLKRNINTARTKLISRYVTVTLLLVFILVEAFIFGVSLSDLSVVFSSVFAVIGIALFATWSILSNVTSGIIMFFSFPYKVGDKIKIHDKDYPIEAIIEDIRAFQLHLRLNNGNLVTYPNSLILQKSVTLVQKDAIDDFE